MPTYLVDTNVWIESFHGNEQAREFLKKDDLFVSYVTKAELIFGARDKRSLSNLEKILGKYSVNWGSDLVNQRALEILIKYRLKQGIGILECMLAATALENKMILITDNIKHFRGIEGLVVKKLSEVI